MKKLIGGLLLTVLILIPVIMYGQDVYEPLSEREATDYILNSVYLQEDTLFVHRDLIDCIIQWDLIQHSVPEIKVPPVIVIAEKRDIYIYYEEPLRLTVGKIKYDIHIEEQIIKDFMPKKDLVSYVLFGLGGVTVGILLTVLLSALL